MQCDLGGLIVILNQIEKVNANFKSSVILISGCRILFCFYILKKSKFRVAEPRYETFDRTVDRTPQIWSGCKASPARTNPEYLISTKNIQSSAK